MENKSNNPEWCQMKDDQDRNVIEILRDMEDKLDELKVDIRGDASRGIKGLIVEKEDLREKIKVIHSKINNMPSSEDKKAMEDKLGRLEKKLNYMEGDFERVAGVPKNTKTILGIILAVVLIVSGVITIFKFFT